MKTKAKQGRPVKGRVFKRGSAYYLRFRVGTDPETGKPNEKTVRLVDPATQASITEERVAWRVAETILAPYKAREMVTLRQGAADALRTAEETVAEAERLSAVALQRKTPLIAMWENYPARATEARKLNARVRELKPAVVRDHAQAWGKFVTFMVGDSARGIEAHYPAVTFAEDVTEEHARAFGRFMLTEERLSHHRHNMVVQLCGAMLRRAGLADPFRIVERFNVTHEHETREPLTVEELKEVCSSATGELRTLLALGVYGGLRLGDACTMKWGEHVRLDEGRLIRKTAKRATVVSFPLHTELRAILAETPVESRRGYVMPDMAAAYLADKTKPSRWVVKHFAQHGLETGKGAGEAASGQRRRAVNLRGFHALRHTFITLCAKAGVPQGAIADWAGHSPDVDRLYQHWSGKDTDARILDALPNVTGNSTARALPAAAEPERAELHRYADTGDIDRVRRCLQIFKTPMG